MAETTKEVVVGIKVADPKGDGLKQVGSQAAAAHKEVNRVAEATKTLARETDKAAKEVKKVNDQYTKLKSTSKELAQGVKGMAAQALQGGNPLANVGSLMGGGGVGMGSLGFIGAAGFAGKQLLDIGLRPDNFIREMRTGTGIISHLVRETGAFKGMDRADAATKRAMERRQQWFAEQQNVLAEFGIRESSRQQGRSLDTTEDRFRQFQLGGDPLLHKQGQAERDRERAAEHLLKLEQELGATGMKDAAKRMVLTQQIREAHEDLLKAEQTKLDVIREQGVAARERMEEEKAHAIDQLQKYRDLHQQEMDRLNSGKEAFGLMDPMKQQSVLGAAKTMMAGGNLSPEQIAMLGSTGIAQDELGRYGRRKADETGIFEQLVRVLGAEAGLKHTGQMADFWDKANIKITQDIKIHLEKDEALLQGLMNALIPELTKMRQAIVREMEAKLRMLQLNKSANNPALGGGGT